MGRAPQADHLEVVFAEPGAAGARPEPAEVVAVPGLAEQHVLAYSCSRDSPQGLLRLYGLTLPKPEDGVVQSVALVAASPSEPSSESPECMIQYRSWPAGRRRQVIGAIAVGGSLSLRDGLTWPATMAMSRLIDLM